MRNQVRLSHKLQRRRRLLLQSQARSFLCAAAFAWLSISESVLSSSFAIGGLRMREVSRSSSDSSWIHSACHRGQVRGEDRC